MTSEVSSQRDISNYYESICYASAVKAHKGEKIGLNVKRSKAWNTLYISGIKQTSKFADSKLKIGMVILTINGMKCPKTVKDMQKVMKECDGDLIIVAATISEEIDIIESSNANSPAHSPAHSPIRSPTRPSTNSSQMVPACGVTEFREFPLGFKTGCNITEDNGTTTMATQPDTEFRSEHQSDRGESLEMTLSLHQKNASFGNPDGYDSDSAGSDASPQQVTPTESPALSPLLDSGRKVLSNSNRRDSPAVGRRAIDHTGGIFVTENAYAEPNVDKNISRNPIQSSEGTKEEEKKDGFHSSRPELNDIDHGVELPGEAFAKSPQQVSQHPQQQIEGHTRWQSVPTIDQDAEKELSTSPHQTTSSLTKQRQQDEADKAIKRRGNGLRLAPAVAPGAHHVSPQPSTVGEKHRHSLSPQPRSPLTPSVPPLYSSLPGSRTNSPSITHGNQSGTGIRTKRRHSPFCPNPQPGAQRVDGMNRRASNPSYPRRASNSSYPRRASNSSNPRLLAKQGYVPAFSTDSLPPIPTPHIPPEEEDSIIPPVQQNSSISSTSNSSNELNDDRIAPSSDYDDYVNCYDSNEFGDHSYRSSIEVSEAPEMSIITSDDLVVAAEVQEHPDLVEDRIRKQILRETTHAAVVMVEHGGNNVLDDSLQEEEFEIHRPKNVKERLFGGGGKGGDVSSELMVAPDEYIRKRDYLPYVVQQNMTTKMWITSVVTNQKAYEEGNTMEQERSKVLFSAKTEREANETGLAMATPYLQPAKNHLICVMCKAKFAVFKSPHNCRNCGVVVCSNCTVTWSSKRFPHTYQTSKSTHSVCLACDWSANNFQDALIHGDLQKAKRFYESGNINLRSPYISSRKKSGQEIMYPIHMAVLGGNVATARWLCKERYAPVTTEVKSKGKLKLLPIATSKGRTPLKLAIKQKNHDMLKFLVSELNVSLFNEDLKSDYRWILAHLSNTLHRAPYESEIARRKRGSGNSHASSLKNPHDSTRSRYRAKVTYTDSTSSAGSPSSRNSRSDSPVESWADSRAEV